MAEIYKQIKDFTLKNSIDGTEDILIQSNGVTMRVKSSQLKTSIDLSNYYTKSEVDNLLANIDVNIDMADYYDKATIDNLLLNKANVSHTHTSADITDLSIPTVDVNKAYVDSQLANKSNTNHTHDEYISETELNEKGYATETYVQTKIAEVATGGTVDLSNYATKTELTTELNKKANSSHTHNAEDINGLNIPTKLSELQNDSGFISEVPSEYINETELNNALANKANTSDIPSLTGYATETFVTNKIAEASLSGGEVNLSGYATKEDLLLKANTSDIPSKTSDLINDSDYTTKTYVDEQISYVSTGDTSVTKYTGKKMDCLGDSITARNVYQGLIKSALGFSEVLNHGIGGTCVAGDGVNAMWQDSRINVLDSNADVILFTGGTNDWQTNLTMGDIASTDTNTFYGACKTVLEKLINKYPNKLILTATPIWGKSPILSSAKNGQGYTIGDYAKALQECSRYYCIPCADVYSNCGFNDLNKSYYFGDVDGTTSDDYIHPNRKYGHPKIANCIIAKLKELDVVVKESEVYGEIVLSTNTIDINEGGSSSFTVRLNAEPTSNQGVSLSCDNSDVVLSETNLTFNSSNYNVEKTININISEDADMDDEIATINVSTINSIQTITVNITDNDDTPTVEPQPGDNLFNTNSKIIYRSGRTQSGASYSSDNTLSFNLEQGSMAGIVVPVKPSTKYKFSYETKTGIQVTYGSSIAYYTAEPTYVQQDETTLIEYEQWTMTTTSNKYIEKTTPENCAWMSIYVYANSAGEGSITGLQLVEVI